MINAAARRNCLPSVYPVPVSSRFPLSPLGQTQTTASDAKDDDAAASHRALRPLYEVIFLLLFHCFQFDDIHSFRLIMDGISWIPTCGCCGVLMKHFGIVVTRYVRFV